MGNLFKNEKIFLLILTIISASICTMFFVENKKMTDGISVSLTANYIPLLINNVYIYYMYCKTKKIKGILDKIICRIKSKRFFDDYVFNSLIDIILFNSITYLIICVILGIDFKYIVAFVLYLITNFSCFFFSEIISMLTLLTKRGNKYIIFPIIVNLVYHYYFVPIIIEKFM